MNIFFLHFWPINKWKISINFFRPSLHEQVFKSDDVPPEWVRSLNVIPSYVGNPKL